MAVVGVTAAVGLSLGDRAEPGPTPWRAPLAARRTAVFPRQIEDATVATRPVRIVAASVLSAEVLLQIAAANLAGVSQLATDPRYCTLATAARQHPQVGAEPEQLLAMRPDLVVVDAFSRAEIPLLLRAAGVPVVRTRTVESFADVADNVRQLGFAVGSDVAAEALVEQMTARLAALVAAAGTVAPWRVMNLNGDLDTYGRRSLLDDAVRATGACHLSARHGVEGYQKLDIETVLAWNPDALIVAGEDSEGDVVAGWIAQHPGLGLLPCVERRRIVRIPAAVLSATSPAAVAIAERLQRQLLAWGRP